MRDVKQSYSIPCTILITFPDWAGWCTILITSSHPSLFETGNTCSVQDPPLVSTSHTVSTLSSDTVSILSSMPVATQPSSPGTVLLVLEIDNVLSVLAVMAMAIICVLATHTTVVSPEVAAFSAEPPEVLYSPNLFLSLSQKRLLIPILAQRRLLIPSQAQCSLQPLTLV